MPLQLHSDIILTIEKPVVGGRMLARHEGQVVFVAGAIPGERVRGRIERVSKQLAYAETVEVIDPSPDRRSSNVDWACGGSLYAHIAYERQLALKAELISDSFTRIGKINLPAPVPITASEEEGYRMRARLHARKWRFGFFREGTHELCDAAPTRQLLPATIDALTDLQDTLTAAGITVSSCEISENVPASERAVALEIEPPSTSPLLLDTIAGITGVLFTDSHSSRLVLGYGSPYVTDRINLSTSSIALTRHVQSFFQGNRYLLQALASHVLEHVAAGQVTDFYSGVGLFAVSLAANGWSDIVAVEGDRSSARDLESNAAPYGSAIRVEPISVEAYLARRQLDRPGTLVLDPPRTGVSSEAIAGILGLKVPRIVYVSCDVATLARDVKRFAEAGYSIDHIEAFDLFPNTAHVETLAVLSH